MGTLHTYAVQQVVISARLFPPPVIALARAFLGPTWVVRVRRQGQGKLAIQIAPRGIGSQRDPAQVLKMALTAAAIQHCRAEWARHRSDRDRPAALEDRRINLSFECFDGRVLACLDASPSLWPMVLRTLARLRLASPVVDSTDPVDRVIISLAVRRGNLVEEALCEFIGTLREELEGPVA